ncbi:MAG: NAD-dependent epimerase/dehydratase family protein [Geobacter sp.]|nr:NAD-dependent epimerase/dehydratase family protein [Geobacter sp.]
MNLLIAGCGDIGSKVAKIAVQRGMAVTAFARSGERAAALQEISLLTGSLDDQESLPAMPTKNAGIIYLIPPPGGGIRDTRVSAFLQNIKAGDEPASIVYISTTSVYGDCGDDLVDETRPVNPANHTARRRCDAEEQFRSWCSAHRTRLIILRVSGIYGPGRIPLHRIQNREPLLDATLSGYTNRIHSEDLAEICLKALACGEDGDIFNVSDNQISKMNDYFNLITDMLGIERLPQVGLDEARKVMTPLMFGYMTESRRIDSRKMLNKLGIELKYPTLQEGLKASL